jgi:hypothetical protein
MVLPPPPAKTPMATANRTVSKPGRARIPRRAQRSLRVEPDKVVRPRQGKPLALPVAALQARTRLAVALLVPRVVASQVLSRVVSLVRRQVLSLAAAQVLPAALVAVVRKRAARTGARPSCGASMNRWAFLTAASGRNSKCWRRTGPRVPERRAMARVPGPMPRATVRARPATVTPLMAKMAKAAKVAKAARTAA